MRLKTIKSLPAGVKQLFKTFVTMTRLSVNINKIATLRNARGGNMPDVEKAAEDCERFGAEGITVHPRPDERHIRYADVPAIKSVISVELNIEGNPIEKFMNLVLATKPAQVTLVPDAENVLTSNAARFSRRNVPFRRLKRHVPEAKTPRPATSWQPMG